jgi:hypothetical protein
MSALTCQTPADCGLGEQCVDVADEPGLLEGGECSAASRYICASIDASVSAQTCQTLADRGLGE